MARQTIDQMLAQDSTVGYRDKDTHTGRVRFWKPAPDLPDEFDCAYLNDGMAAPHIHEEWQFAVAGVASAISVGAFRRYIARPSEVMVVHPYDAHSEHGMLGGPREWWVLHVAPSVIDRAYGDATRRSPRFDRPVLQDSQSARTLGELLRASLDGYLIGTDFVNQTIDWLGALLRGHRVRPSAPATSNGAPAPIERAREYLRAHATDPLLLSDLVSVAGVTTSHFVRSFSRRVGLPPRSYQTQLRLARARRLLAQGRPATWVAYECGFADQSHLSRRFKEFYGLTPGGYQAHYQPPAIAATVGFDAA